MPTAKPVAVLIRTSRAQRKRLRGLAHAAGLSVNAYVIKRLGLTDLDFLSDDGFDTTVSVKVTAMTRNGASVTIRDVPIKREE